MHAPRARRSELATPASSERMCEKAPSSGADLVFLDLEDACAPVVKESARAIAVNALDQPGLGPCRAGGAGQRPRHPLVLWGRGRDRHRRPRGARCHHRPEGPLGPRRLVVRRPAHPARDEARPDQAHRRWRSSSRRPRDSRTRRRSPGQRSPGGDHLRRRRPLGIDARTGGRQLRSRWASTRATSGTSPGSRSWPPPGGGHRRHRRSRIPPIKDPDGYRRAAEHASLLGYDGKWAIHPGQVPIANAVFAPTAAEIADAEESIAIYRKSEAEGVGAIGREGKLVDAAHMRLAANVLHRGGSGRVRGSGS